MHEIGIVKGIIKKVLEVAESSKGRKVAKIKVRAGMAEMLSRDAMQEVFSMLAKDTIIKDAVIELEEFEGSGISIDGVEIED